MIVDITSDVILKHAEHCLLLKKGKQNESEIDVKSSEELFQPTAEIRRQQQEKAMRRSEMGDDEQGPH